MFVFTRPATSALALTAVATLMAGPAHAVVQWDGDASQGTGVFKNLEQHEGSITAVTDAVQGRIFRFHKPLNSNRCESRGIRINGAGYTFRNGDTHYFGWRSRLTTTADNNANFQWKAYGNHIQNWPVVLKLVGGQATVIQRQPGNVVSTIWQRPISANTWNHYILGLHLSDATRGGWVELWMNGSRQTFNDGTQRYMCRTFDDIVDPKWGIYGGSSMAMTNDVDALKMGTTPADVAEGPIVTPTATPTPTPTSPVATPTPTSTPTPQGPSEFIEITPPGSAVTASTSDSNVGSNVVDNNLATRWSGNGDGAWVQLDLGSDRVISHVRVGVYQGNVRRNRFEIQLSSGGGVWNTVFNGESNGTTTGEVTYDFPTATARYVRYLGHGNVGSTNPSMNSVTEISVYTFNVPTTPTPTPTSPAGPVEVTPGGASVSASTNDGNLPANTVDDNLATRWSANGDGQWIQYDLGSTRTVTSVSLAWYQGNTRSSTFDVLASDSAAGPWSTLAAGRTSSGTTTALESHDVTDGAGRYLRIVGHGNSTNAWNSLSEIAIFAAP